MAMDDYTYELDTTLTVSAAKDLVRITTYPNPTDPRLPRNYGLRLLRVNVNAAETTTDVLPIRIYKASSVCFGNPSLGISANFDVVTGSAVYYSNNKTRKKLNSGTVFDTGTSATIAADKWGIALLCATSAGAGTVTWATNAGAGYDTEALALAALPATPTNETRVGYVTVKTATGQPWTAGTDALKTGTGGDVASETNYYAVNGTAIVPTPRLGSPALSTLGASAETLPILGSDSTGEIFRQGVLLEDGFEWDDEEDDLIDVAPGDSLIIRLDSAPSSGTDLTVAVTFSLVG